MFPGAAIKHVAYTYLNLVIKVILCQFHVLKPGRQALDVALQVLVDLAGDIEMEEAIMDKRDDDEEDDDDDEEEGSID